jgi:ankyrin repeat protein
MKYSSYYLHAILVFFVALQCCSGFTVTGPSTNPKVRQTAIHVLEIPSVEAAVEVDKDNRPFAQRVSGPRPARRLNHAFRYLYRHDAENGTQSSITSFDFLTHVVGFTAQEVQQMNQTFPPLLELNVQRHLKPKLRFLTETLELKQMSEVRQHVPPQYFGARLERIIAPRHAFLVYYGLFSGRDLILDPNRWRDFLLACRKPKQFCALCNQWKREMELTAGTTSSSPIVIKQIEAFEVLFQRGLMAAARNELCQWNKTWPLDHVNISSAEMISLLIQHGANPLEQDARGSSLLHWAAGTGHLDNIKVLLSHFDKGVFEETERDGATPLHWASAGANAREFGIGGHVDVCRYLLEQAEDTKGLVNQLTKDGNSALMWSSWAASLDVVKLLVRNRADPLVANRNGCTVAHWAASGGNLECCRYLHETVGVDFSLRNYGGNTPLTHAVAFGRADVVEWLHEEVLSEDEDDTIAAALAQDFVAWTDGDEKRKLVLSLFQDWYGGDELGTDDTPDVQGDNEFF